MKRLAVAALGLAALCFAALLACGPRAPRRALSALETVQLHETGHDTSSHEEGHKESHEGHGHEDKGHGHEDEGHGHEDKDSDHASHADHAGHADDHHHVYKKKRFGRSEMSSTIGTMLIGGVAFQMSLFYLVNNADPDIRRYMWTVIGTTISIFSAVLLFQSVEGVLHKYVLEEFKKKEEDGLLGFGIIGMKCVMFLHMFLWFVLTQVVVCYIATSEKRSKQESAKPYKEMPLQQDGANVPTVPQKMRTSRTRNATPTEYQRRNKSSEKAKSIGGLFAHITAFAAIKVFEEIQDELATYGLGIIMPVVCASVFLGLFKIAWEIRTKIMEEDGDVDQAEIEWEHYVREIEDDILALSTSYLIMKSVSRLVEGGPPQHEHEPVQVAMMFVAALIALAGMTFFVYASKWYHHGGDHPHHSSTQSTRHESSLPAHRMVEMSKFLCTFCFAWCMLNGSTWIVMVFQNAHGWTHIWAEVLEALVVSFTCVFIIIILDKVADLDETGPEVDEAIRDSVLAFGFLIGFCWEHAFDIGVISITRRFEAFQEIAQFFMCSFITLIVFPAYVMYIVPIQFRMHEEKLATPVTTPRIEGAGLYEATQDSHTLTMDSTQEELLAPEAQEGPQGPQGGTLAPEPKA